jgi:uncharacterized delta-60 repeat protein
VASLAVLASSTAATRLSIPANTPAGPYYVCLKADSADTVGEKHEDNNTQCSLITVTVPVHILSITTTAVGSHESKASALAVQPSDGKLVTAGYSYNGSSYVFALVRYNTNGSPDATFGSKGIVTTDLGVVDAEVFAVAVQPSDGKLVAAGFANDGSKSVFALVRYNTNGSLDTNFGSGGIVTTDIGGVDSTAFAMAVQPSDGKLVVAGYANVGGQNVFAVARYNTDGGLDTAFNPSGTIPGVTTKAIGTVDDEAFALAVQPDGNLVVAGYSYNDPTSASEVLARFNGTDGSLDTTFNSGGAIPGVVAMAIGGQDTGAYAIAIQPSDGKLVAGGYTHDNALPKYIFALTRFNTDGSLDTTFNSMGAVPGAATVAFGDIDDEVFALAVQSDGKLLAAGDSDIGSQQYIFALARFNTDGTPDMTFNGTGKITTVIGNDDVAFAIGIQPDGSWAAVGYTMKGIYEFAVVRYGY